MTNTASFVRSEYTNQRHRNEQIEKLNNTVAMISDVESKYKIQFTSKKGFFTFKKSKELASNTIGNIKKAINSEPYSKIDLKRDEGG